MKTVSVIRSKRFIYSREVISKELATVLEHLSELVESSDSAKESLLDLTTIERARRFLQSQKRCRDIFGAIDGMFGDPALSVLLELYVRQFENRKTSVSAAASTSYLPTSTAMRWLSSLVVQDLILRTRDPADNRRQWVTLTEKAVELIEAYLSQI